jgi:single-strand DNA-binding protein
MSDSPTTIVGNVTRDPELKFLTSGQAAVQFGVAVNRRYQKDNEWVEETSFFDVVAYGSLAENLATSLHQGARALVHGRLQQRSWETQEGEKRSKIELVAEAAGPELKWATADITKNERRSEGNGNASRPKATASAAKKAAPTEEPW